MSNEYDISEAQLNAFVDEQLDTEEKSQVYAALQQDKELNRRVCELRQLRNLVQHAYQDIPPPPSARRRNYGAQLLRAVGQSMAAGLLIALGGLGGWFAHGRVEAQQPVPTQLSGIAPQAYQNLKVSAAQPQVETHKLLLHVDSGDPTKLREVLDKAESLLTSYRQKHEPLRVEIVANGGGLKLLQAKASPYPQRVERLMASYDNITFLACAKAIQKYQARGDDTELLPNTAVTRSAMEQIVRRLEQGWLYIKV